jgi:hypothetical protein
VDSATTRNARATTETEPEATTRTMETEDSTGKSSVARSCKAIAKGTSAMPGIAAMAGGAGKQRRTTTT